MAERYPPHLRLVPAASVDGSAQLTQSNHPSLQPRSPGQEFVFEWHGVLQQDAGETPCCHQRIEVSNLVSDHHNVVHDLGAALSVILHEWDGYDAMVLVTLTPSRSSVSGGTRPHQE